MNIHGTSINRTQAKGLIHAMNENEAGVSPNTWGSLIRRSLVKQVRKPIGHTFQLIHTPTDFGDRVLHELLKKPFYAEYANTSRKGFRSVYPEPVNEGAKSLKDFDKPVEADKAEAKVGTPLWAAICAAEWTLELNQGRLQKGYWKLVVYYEGSFYAIGYDYTKSMETVKRPLNIEVSHCIGSSVLQANTWIGNLRTMGNFKSNK